jgi:hypothetical protein
MKNRIIKTVLFSILATLFLVGCAANKAFWGDPETGLILQYRFVENEPIQYKSQTNTVITQEMMGQTMEIVSDVMTGYSVKGLGFDEQSNLLTRFTLDSASLTAKSPQGENIIDLSKLFGKGITISMSPLGEELDTIEMDSAEVEIGMMGGGGSRNIKSFFRRTLPNLPDHPVKIGESWTTTRQDTQTQSGMDIISDIETESTLEGLETINGFECVKIINQITGVLEGIGEQMGMQLSYEGDMGGTSTWYFAYKQGVFVKLNNNNFIEGTVAASGQMNMTIPMTQEIKTQVDLIQ